MRTSTRMLSLLLGTALLGGAWTFRASHVEASQKETAQTETAQTPVVAQKTAQKIAWRKSFASALAEAKRTRKPLLVDFNAAWCAPCKELDRRTFTDAAVIAQSRRFIPVKVDIDKEPKIAARYNVEALPTVAVLKANGTMASYFLGYRPPAFAVAFLKDAHKKAR